MTRIHWQVMDNTPKVIAEGEAKWSEAVTIKAPLPACVLSHVQAESKIGKFPIVFMNGYQSWTWSPYMHAQASIRGVAQIPSFLEKKYAFSAYGDYTFVRYPNKAGQLHGVSYCAFSDSLADDTIELYASLDESDGYTLFAYDADSGTLHIEKDGARQTDGHTRTLFKLFHARGRREAVYRQWFDAMGLPVKETPHLFGYSSWYNRYQNISEKTILDDLCGCDTLFEKNDLFQIDDGWERAVGDWQADTDKFPNGMRYMADQIHARGYRAGLWLAPFAAEKKSRLAQEHPDWLLRNPDGSLWQAGGNWSGFYGLDIDLEPVRAYVRKTFETVFAQWKFDLVKLDFLYAAAPFTGLNDSRGAKMHRAMRLLADCCKEHPIIGCGVPLAASFGLVSYCRIGCDVSFAWDDVWYMRLFHRERNSTWHSVMDTIGRFPLDAKAFGNDPDVFFLRDENLHLPMEDKLDLARLDALLGHVHLLSDPIQAYTEEKKRFYKEMRALAEAVVTSYALLDKGIRITYTLKGKTETITLFKGRRLWL